MMPQWGTLDRDDWVSRPASASTGGIASARALRADEVEAWLDRNAALYTGRDYQLLDRNCISFARHFCQALLHVDLPEPYVGA